MGLLASLSREQKESIVLLQTGTFLEYFDLMLYVHMAVLLNELFFPKYDPQTASLMTAIAFCSSYVMRPVGALIFGWIGDHIGRKPTIIITTAMMAISCLVMFNLPTYAQIGITAAWIVTICRMVQGMSSMGEMIGAQIYLTESIQRPFCFPIIALIEVFCSLGGLSALGIAFFVTSFGFNWRFAFLVGAGIAVVSVFARIRLRETPEFIEMKRKWLKKEIHEANLEGDPLHGAEINATWKEPIEIKTLISYLLISLGYPLCFYMAFFYFNPTLRENFGYSAEDIINHNFFLALILVSWNIFISYSSYHIYPLTINKIRGIIGLFLVISIPFLMMNINSPVQLFFIQVLILVFALNDVPSAPIFLSHFPLYCRFTSASLLFSVSRALMFAVTAFGLVYLEKCYGHFGLWIIFLPTTVAYLYGIRHFENLEHKFKLYPNFPYKWNGQVRELEGA